ncbi:methyltransferase [Streptomyces sp. AS58]|uniref:Putative sugar O-methyltransferase n=1 Tax=Streptomyces cadmiisoli TaxID=2184053 RepID=A0A2Z4IX67_9ACTN|nr:MULTISPECIES: putative sugar O-methyltransferase [Streptomyces]AWW37581.1 putative sugar O-methyltransferase [Streptomyces cadmiisoli]KOV71428.1 methyltransferase [Streptomyces sp. AS58]
MGFKPQVNELWKYIGENEVNEELIGDLADFKTSQVNYRLTYFDVRTNGVRYLKTLIYNLAGQLSADNWDRLRRISGRDLGRPYAVTYDGESVDLDYLRAVSDLEFIEKNVDLDGGRVLEIGAGYGRTCHTLMSNKDIAAYTIIDLPTTMALSRKYLRAVLPDEEFKKITFIPIDEIEASLGDAEFDLCINIDSLAEMDVKTVRYYLSLIAERGRNFYTNNPVGKYMDKSLDDHARGEAAIARALDAGLLTDVIDVHDNRAVREQARKFVVAYRPHESWSCVADEWAAPFTWYWQALYQAPAEGR